MKKTFMAMLVLVAMCTTTPWLAEARSSGPSANGTYTVVFEDNLTKTVEFNASSDERGTITGEMTFRDEARVVEIDVDGDGRPPEEPTSNFFITASLDTLTIDRNRALMGGTVRDSSNQSYIGRWVQLVVEDNGNDSDKLTWCFCQPEAGGWVPKDFDDPRDEGAWLHWWSTDADLRDDVGVASPNIIPGSRTSCPTFPLSTYEFPDARGEGQIQVLP